MDVSMVASAPWARRMCKGLLSFIARFIESFGSSNYEHFLTFIKIQLNKNFKTDDCPTLVSSTMNITQPRKDKMNIY